MKWFLSLLAVLAMLCTAASYNELDSSAMAKPLGPTQARSTSKHVRKSTGTTNLPSVDRRVNKLHGLLAEQWEYTLRTSPEFASILGDKRYNDKLSDFSQTAIESDLRRQRIFLRQFE